MRCAHLSHQEDGVHEDDEEEGKKHEGYAEGVRDGRNYLKRPTSGPESSGGCFERISCEATEKRNAREDKIQREVERAAGVREETHEAKPLSYP